MNDRIDKLQALASEINIERKQEADIIQYIKNQKIIAQYYKIIYDEYINQGFSDINAIYLTGLQVQINCK